MSGLSKGALKKRVSTSSTSLTATSPQDARDVQKSGSAWRCKREMWAMRVGHNLPRARGSVLCAGRCQSLLPSRNSCEISPSSRAVEATSTNSSLGSPEPNAVLCYPGRKSKASRPGRRLSISPAATVLAVLLQGSSCPTKLPLLLIFLGACQNGAILARSRLRQRWGIPPTPSTLCYCKESMINWQPTLPSTDTVTDPSATRQLTGRGGAGI